MNHTHSENVLQYRVYSYKNEGKNKKRKEEKESTADASSSQRRPDDLIPSAVQFSACNFGDDLLQFDFAAQCPISDLESFIQQANKRTRQVQNPGESTQETLSCHNRYRCIHISLWPFDNASSTPSLQLEDTVT